ncbi:regulatory protein RecX [Thermocaproicibacter melissae]|jgi:regulatory protein|uniref:regulatory protein RecX n=1 Tax=Thermocaproicibacter melissae TaxID=2966552 RepID=UPI0024B1744D|nr:regulatory protein RecX [Thermocaproicibacter melissae]WBY63777.1 regulatory protein RecX [Thermocaproicibacter melissae]
MMLTAVEPRRKGLVALYIDGEKAVDLDAEVYLKSGLKPGDELDDEQLRNLIAASDARRAEQKAMYLLGFRAHSEKELARKLSRTVPREAAEKVAARMAELGLVNDEEYARTLARELFARKHYAAGRVRMELMRRGIPPELAQEAVEEARTDPQEAIRELVERKYERYLGDEKGRRKTVAALQRLGYQWDDIRCVLNEFTASNEDE